MIDFKEYILPEDDFDKVLMFSMRIADEEILRRVFVDGDNLSDFAGDNYNTYYKRCSRFCRFVDKFKEFIPDYSNSQLEDAYSSFKFSDRTIEMLDKHFLEGATCTNIADYFEVSRQFVSKKIKLVEAKLQDAA